MIILVGGSVILGCNYEAYAHGLPISIRGPPVRIDNEQFSRVAVNAGGSDGSDIIRITGSVRNVSEQEFKVSPYVFVTPGQFVDSQGIRHGGGASTFYYLVSEIYPPHRDTASWYFAVEHDLPNPLVLEPGGSAEYEIRLYPLKAGCIMCTLPSYLMMSGVSSAASRQ
jgi:hypothetical protein